MNKTSTWKGFFYCIMIGVFTLTSFIGFANFDDNDYELAITEKRYNDALTILNNKEEEKQTVPEKELINGLEVVIDVTALEWPKIQWP